MSRSRRVRAAVLVLVSAIVGLLATSGPAAAQDAPRPIVVFFSPIHPLYWYRVCLKTDTSIREYKSQNGDRVCTGTIKNMSDEKFTLQVDYTLGDQIYVDFELFTGLAGESKTQDNINITGSYHCNISGSESLGKLYCPLDGNAGLPTVMFTPEPFRVAVGDPQDPVIQILNLMAWCVSAAAVIGLVITGAQLAMQLRHGVPGEVATAYVRPMAIIFAACALAVSAGPLVAFLGLGQ